MLKQIKRVGKNIWDFYRTAPYGETFLLTFVTPNIYSLFYSKNPGELVYHLFFSTLFSLAGGFMIQKQFKLRKRLEKAIEKHGYQDRIFKPTLNEWCDRQTAMVVCRNHGHLENYFKLYNSKKDELRGLFKLTFSLPHF